jgi:flagellar basal-body rod protein FlgG
MLTAQKRMDAISDNLANIDTAGYKKDDLSVESFNDVLIQRQNGSRLTLERGREAIEVTEDNGRYLVKTTDGYFRVATPEGTSHNKELAFHVDDEGYLSTYYQNSNRTINERLGHRVLGRGGEIFVGEGDLTIAENGAVQVDGNEVDRLLFHPGATTIGTMNAGVWHQRKVTDFSQGQLERTDGPFDLALRGDGFFTIETPEGEYFTRNGVFSRNQFGELVTLDGHRVMGFDGPIELGEGDFAVNRFGEILQNGEIVDRLDLVRFTNLGDLAKVGGTLFTALEPIEGEREAFEGEVLQGFIERPNVEAITEMVKMIEMSRNYESDQKVIATIDEMLGKAVNEVGAVR